MLVLILRPYRKDNIYFRSIEEREKIKYFSRGNEKRNNVCTSMVLYRELCQTFELSPYLINIDNRKHRNSLAKFIRLSSHQLLLKQVDILVATGTIDNLFYVQKMILKTSFTSFLFARSIKNYVHSLSQGITTLILVCSNLYN